MTTKYETEHKLNIDGHDYELNIEFELSEVASSGEGEEQQVMDWWVKDDKQLALESGEYTAGLIGEEVFTESRPYPIILDSVREKKITIDTQGMVH